MCQPSGASYSLCECRFNFFLLNFDWLGLLKKKLIIIIYFHFDLVYHIAYFNYELDLRQTGKN
jgi:hypothetical protein